MLTYYHFIKLYFSKQLPFCTSSRQSNISRSHDCGHLIISQYSLSFYLWFWSPPIPEGKTVSGSLTVKSPYYLPKLAMIACLSFRLIKASSLEKSCLLRQKTGREQDGWIKTAKPENTINKLKDLKMLHGAGEDCRVRRYSNSLHPLQFPDDFLKFLLYHSPKHIQFNTTEH